MKKITTLLCGIAMAAALSTPVHAGGQSTTGSSTSAPGCVVASSFGGSGSSGAAGGNGGIVRSVVGSYAGAALPAPSMIINNQNVTGN